MDPYEHVMNWHFFVLQGFFILNKRQIVIHTYCPVLCIVMQILFSPVLTYGLKSLLIKKDNIEKLQTL